MNKEQLIAELTAGDIPASVREQIVAEFRTQVQEQSATITELQATVAEYQRQATTAAIDAKVVELTAWNVTGDAAKAKLWATELQDKVIDTGVQLHGGYGYMMEYPVAKAFIDARVQRIYGGTNEIMKEIIHRDLLR